MFLPVPKTSLPLFLQASIAGMRKSGGADMLRTTKSLVTTQTAGIIVSVVDSIVFPTQIVRNPRANLFRHLTSSEKSPNIAHNHAKAKCLHTATQLSRVKTQAVHTELPKEHASSTLVAEGPGFL